MSATYIFNGCIKHFNNVIDNDKDDKITQAISKEKAINNIVYREKIKHNYSKDAKCHAIGTLRVIYDSNYVEIYKVEYENDTQTFDLIDIQVKLFNKYTVNNKDVTNAIEIVDSYCVEYKKEQYFVDSDDSNIFWKNGHRFTEYIRRC